MAKEYRRIPKQSTLDGETKQDPVNDALADTATLLTRVGISDYGNTIVAKGEEFSLLTARATIDDVTSILDVAVNIPDAEMRQVVADGGKHIGLIDLDRDTRASTFRVLHAGRVNGDGPIEIARRLRSDIPKGRFSTPGIRAKVIARTETKYAQNVSSVRAYSNSRVVDGLRVFDAQLGDTDEDCQARNNTVITFAEGRALADIEHPNGTLNFAPEVDERARLERKLSQTDYSDYTPPSHDCTGADCLSAVHNIPPRTQARLVAALANVERHREGIQVARDAGRSYATRQRQLESSQRTVASIGERYDITEHLPTRANLRPTSDVLDAARQAEERIADFENHIRLARRTGSPVDELEHLLRNARNTLQRYETRYDLREARQNV